MTTLTSPHDLLHAIPFLIGYHPQDSLVIVGLTGDSIGLAMRMDYPDTGMPDFYGSITKHLVDDGATSALLAAYMPLGRSDGEEVAGDLIFALNRDGISVRESLIIEGDRYRSTLCTDCECCPLTGTLIPDISSSRIAAEEVSMGRPMPFASIDDMALSIAPSAIAQDPTWISLVQSFWVDPDFEDLNPLQIDGATAIVDLAGEYQEGRSAQDSELIARVIGRMTEIQVRDFALGVHSIENSDIYWAMWRQLLRIAPAGFVAPVACVFAAIAYERGAGALAQKALDRAVVDNPDYSLTTLLRRVFNAGWPPSAFSQMRSTLHPKVCQGIFG